MRVGTKLEQVVRHRDDGSTVTAGEHIIERTELGLTKTNAAAEAGITRECLRQWQYRGANARRQEIAGLPVDPKDLPFIDWLNRFEAAETAAELRYLSVVDQAATEAQRIRKITVKRELRPNPAGSGPDILVETERTETVEERPPVWEAAKWRLQTMSPGRYTIRPETAEAEATVTRDERASALVDSLEGYLAGIAESTGDLHGPVELPAVEE